MSAFETITLDIVVSAIHGAEKSEDVEDNYMDRMGRRVYLQRVAKTLHRALIKVNEDGDVIGQHVLSCFDFVPGEPLPALRITAKKGPGT